jgi:hypothetical protein
MSAGESRKGRSKFKITNWKEYNASLVQRGSINFWIHKDAISEWHPKTKVKKHGGQIQYSDLAIQTCLTFRLLYRFGLRQTEGFMNSLLELMNLDLVSPDYTTISKRSDSLKDFREKLKKIDKGESVNILVDSTGLKIYGEGEWKEEKHGKGKRKDWMRLHLGINEDTREIEASILTDNHTGDASQVKPLLNQVKSKIKDVKADGAYDTQSVLEALKEVGIEGKGIFPPRVDAILSKDWKTNPTQRDLNIFRIHMDGRDVWEYASGYSKRNLVENAMFRYKNYFETRLKARNTKKQEAETKLAVHILNQMTRLGMPKSVRI